MVSEAQYREKITNDRQRRFLEKEQQVREAFEAYIKARHAYDTKEDKK